MSYDGIIFIGYGSLLKKCLRFAKQNAIIRLIAIETEANQFSDLSKFCAQHEIENYQFFTKAEIESFFQKVTANFLVVSIHNKYLFRKNVLQMDNLRIINFHNSLLPRHAGRNAPNWAIYEMDEVAGITWHEVTEQIDGGDIIIQKQIHLSPDITAIELVTRMMIIGLETFKEIFPLLITNTYLKIPQKLRGVFSMHYSWQLPNDGIFNATWSLFRMSAFLRAFDNGPYLIFRRPAILINGTMHEIIKYEISKPPVVSGDQIDSGTPQNNSIYFYDEKMGIKVLLGQSMKK